MMSSPQSTEMYPSLVPYLSIILIRCDNYYLPESADSRENQLVGHVYFGQRYWKCVLEILNVDK